MPEKKEKKITLRTLTIAGTAAVVLLACIIYVVYNFEPATALQRYLESHVHPAVFLALMLVLPLIGAPISIFLVLIGIKFGIVEGMLLSAGIMFCHMAVTHYLTHTFLRRWIINLLEPYSVTLPKLKADTSHRHAFIFMLIPGLPYAVKNNLLALTDLPFIPYMTINWIAQYGVSFPFIILGGAILTMDLRILMIALTLLLGGYLLRQFLRKKQGATPA